MFLPRDALCSRPLRPVIRPHGAVEWLIRVLGLLRLSIAAQKCLESSTIGAGAERPLTGTLVSRR